MAILVAVFLASLWLSASAAFALEANVRNAPYNARGDGVTNDRAAIQAAIDAVTAAGGGKVIVPGTFTYLTGELQLKRSVNLEIQAGAKIKQSTRTTDNVHETLLGRNFEAREPIVAWDQKADWNYPIIYATSTSGVSVTGRGTIEASYTGRDETSIFQYAIGFNLVNSFTISEVTITGSPIYNVAIKNSENGTIRGITIREPRSLNSDGISLMNSQSLIVRENSVTTEDDGIYVWASYRDPRGYTWWNSNTARESKNIEIFNNRVIDVDTGASHGFLFINWTSLAEDASRVEISNIYVHDNSFRGPYALGALVRDPHGGHEPEYAPPTKNLTFERNELISTQFEEVGETLSSMSTSNLWADSADYSFTPASLSEGIYNNNFDAGGFTWPTQILTSFWTLTGTGTVTNTAVGQPGGYYGQISGASAASVTQGLFLRAGRYTFGASVQSSGVRNRLVAIQRTSRTTSSVIASLGFTNTRWEARSLTFEVRTAGVYLLGIDNEGSSSEARSFGRIDSTSIR
jgi:polygalacturonase